MRRVGTVVRLAQGLVVVRADDEAHPELGAEVVDEALDVVGEVVDVFGPVERPYVAVTPEASVHEPSLAGAPLYAR